MTKIYFAWYHFAWSFFMLLLQRPFSLFDLTITGLVLGMSMARYHSSDRYSRVWSHTVRNNISLYLQLVGYTILYEIIVATCGCGQSKIGRAEQISCCSMSQYNEWVYQVFHRRCRCICCFRSWKKFDLPTNKMRANKISQNIGICDDSQHSYLAMQIFAISEAVEMNLFVHLRILIMLQLFGVRYMNIEFCTAIRPLWHCAQSKWTMFYINQNGNFFQSRIAPTLASYSQRNIAKYLLNEPTFYRERKKAIVEMIRVRDNQKSDGAYIRAEDSNDGFHRTFGEQTIRIFVDWPS